MEELQGQCRRPGLVVGEPVPALGPREWEDGQVGESGRTRLV